MARHRSRPSRKSGPWSTLARKSRWSVEEAEALFEAQAESGETVAAFARRHGLGVARLYAWRQRLGRVKPGRPVTRLLPVKIATGSWVTRELIEIELGNGRRLRVPETVDSAALGRLIEVLERATC